VEGSCRADYDPLFLSIRSVNRNSSVGGGGTGFLLWRALAPVTLPPLGGNDVSFTSLSSPGCHSLVF